MKEIEKTTEAVKKSEKKQRPVGAWILFGLAVIYTISPVDLIPDIPVVGWIDDMTLLVSSVLNLIQKQSEAGNEKIAAVLKYIKWTVFALGLIIVLLLVLLAYFAISLF